MFELGNNLREARQRRRIDLVAAEQDTKIRSKYLAALETEDFDILPGPVFVRGFLRTYSRYLGLDSQLFIDEYNARFGRFEEVEEHGSPALGRPGLAHEHATRGRRTMRLVVILTMIVLALLLWLALREGGATATTRTPGHVARPAAEPTTPTRTLDDPDALRAAAKAAATPAARSKGPNSARRAVPAEPRAKAGTQATSR